MMIFQVCFAVAAAAAPRLAVVVPHVPGDETTITDAITALWSQHAPCAVASAGSSNAPLALPTLVLYAAHPTFSAEECARLLAQPHIQRCFAAVEMLVNPLELWQDVYRYAPPLMWLNLLLNPDALSARFDYFFLMEPDVLPVRSNWLTELSRVVSLNEADHSGARWWASGSVGTHTMPGDDGGVDGRSPSARLHLNGNGIYRLHDVAFEAFARETVEHYALGRSEQSVCCYDAALYEHALASYERTHLVLHRFRWSELVLNNQLEWMRNETRAAEFKAWTFASHIYFVHKGTVKVTTVADEDIARINPLAADALSFPSPHARRAARREARHAAREAEESVARASARAADAVRLAAADAAARCDEIDGLPQILAPVAGAAFAAGETVTMRISIHTAAAARSAPYALSIDGAVRATGSLAAMGWVARGERATVEVRFTDIAPGTTHRLALKVNDACAVSVPIVVWEATSGFAVLGQAFRSFARPLLLRPELSMKAYAFDDPDTAVRIHPVAAMVGGGFGMVRMDDGAPVSFDATLVRLAHARLRGLHAALEGPVFMLDLGANTGCFSLLAAFAPWLHVVAFEPVRFTGRVLRANVELNALSERVAVSSFALSDCTVRRDTIAVPTHLHHGGLSTIAASPTRFSVNETERIPILLASLDAIFPLFAVRVPRVDFMKIDVEGAEVRALRGAAAVLARWLPHVLIEEHAANLRAFDVTIIDVELLLRGHGYERVASTGPSDTDGSRDSLYVHPGFWSVEGRLGANQDAASAARAERAVDDGLRDGVIPHPNVQWGY